MSGGRGSDRDLLGAFRMIRLVAAFSLRWTADRLSTGLKWAFSGLVALFGVTTQDIRASEASLVTEVPPISWQFWMTGVHQDLVEGDGVDGSATNWRIDLRLVADTARMGLWDGGSVHTHLTYRDGDPRPFRGGALWPTDSAGLLPLGSDGDLVATSLYLGQRIGESSMLLAGKIDAIDLLASSAFFGGRGTDRFMNVVFVAPPSGVVPPVLMGAVLVHQFSSVKLTTMVFDPGDQTRNYSFDDLFSDGVNLSAGLAWSGSAAGRPVTFGGTATYSTAEGRDWGDFGLPPGTQTTVRDGSYNVAVEGSILLAESAVKANQGLGLYAKAAIADGNPNAIRASVIGGIAGHGVVPGRPDDSFGVGIFHYDFSNELQDVASAVGRFDDERGIEAFYSLGLTSWLHVSVDLQWIDPATAKNDPALLASLRVRIAP